MRDTSIGLSSNLHYEKIGLLKQMLFFLKEFTFGRMDILPFYELWILFTMYFTITFEIFDFASCISIISVLIVFYLLAILAFHNPISVWSTSIISILSTFLLLNTLHYFDILVNFMTLLILYSFILYVILKLMKSIYYIMLVPLSLRQDIYINCKRHEISFSQNKLLHERYKFFPNIALITYCLHTPKDQNFEKIKRDGIVYLYHSMMKLSKQRAEKFTQLFIFNGIFLILYFFLILVYEFYFIDIFTPHLNCSSDTINSNVLFILANIPIVVFSVDAINNILSKKYIYIKLLDKSSEDVIGSSLTINDNIRMRLRKNYLLDYKINDEDMSYISIKKLPKEHEVNLMIQLIIAIFLTIGIPLSYNRVYTDSSKIDIPQTIESIQDRRKSNEINNS
jgi:hypothetical protein